MSSQSTQNCTKSKTVHKKEKRRKKKKQQTTTKTHPQPTQHLCTAQKKRDWDSSWLQIKSDHENTDKSPTLGTHASLTFSLHFYYWTCRHWFLTQWMTQSMCPANNLVMLELFWMNCKLIFHFATPHSILSVVCLYIEMSRSIHLLPQPCHLLQGIMFHHLEVSHKWHGLILSKRPNKNGEDKMVCFFFLKKKWICKVANLNTSTKQTIKDTVLKLQKLFVVLWVYRTNHQRCYLLGLQNKSSKMLFCCVLWVYKTNHQRCYFVVSSGSTEQITEDIVLLRLLGLQNKSLKILFCCVFWVYRTNHWRYCFETLQTVLLCLPWWLCQMSSLCDNGSFKKNPKDKCPSFCTFSACCHGGYPTWNNHSSITNLDIFMQFVPLEVILLRPSGWCEQLRMPKWCSDSFCGGGSQILYMMKFILTRTHLSQIQTHLSDDDNHSHSKSLTLTSHHPRTLTAWYLSVGLKHQLCTTLCNADMTWNPHPTLKRHATVWKWGQSLPQKSL